MAKELQDEVQQSRKEKLSKTEQLAGLIQLRRKGILTRQQFRLLTSDKGLQGSTKGSPLFTDYEITKDKNDRRVITSTVKQWVRI